METFDVSEVRRGLLRVRAGDPHASPRTRAAALHRAHRAAGCDLGDAWRVEVYRHGQTASSREDLDEVVGDLAASIDSGRVRWPTMSSRPTRSFSWGTASAACSPERPSCRTPGPGADRRRRATVRGRRRSVASCCSAAERGVPVERRRCAVRVAHGLRAGDAFADFAVEKVRTGGYWITDLRRRGWTLLPSRGSHGSCRCSVDATTREPPGHPRREVHAEHDRGRHPGCDARGPRHLATAEDPDERYAQLRTTILGRGDEGGTAPTAPGAKGRPYFVLHGIGLRRTRTGAGSPTADAATGQRARLASSVPTPGTSALSISPPGHAQAQDPPVPEALRRRLRDRRPEWLPFRGAQQRHVHDGPLARIGFRRCVSSASSWRARSCRETSR